MVLIFKYHSVTQRLVHSAPLVLLLCLMAAAFGTGNDELANYLGVAAFGWLLVANFLINLLISRFGTRLGPIDFSQNLHPSKTERVARWVIFLVSAAVGLVATVIVVPHIKRGALLFGAGTFFLALTATATFLYLAVMILSGFQIRPPDRIPKRRSQIAPPT